MEIAHQPQRFVAQRPSWKRRDFQHHALLILDARLDFRQRLARQDPAQRQQGLTTFLQQIESLGTFLRTHVAAALTCRKRYACGSGVTSVAKWKSATQARLALRVSRARRSFAGPVFRDRVDVQAGAADVDQAADRRKPARVACPARSLIDRACQRKERHSSQRGQN